MEAIIPQVSCGVTLYNKCVAEQFMISYDPAWRPSSPWYAAG
jgi:hypothetical protein